MFALTLLLIACATEDKAVESADPCADETYHLTWANWGDGFFANYCRACHSADAPDRFDAPEGINFDTVEDVAQWNDLIRSAVLVDGRIVAVNEQGELMRLKAGGEFVLEEKVDLGERVQASPAVSAGRFR